MARDASSNLEPMAPAEGIDLYLSAKKDELTKSTLKGQRYRLEAFLQWCDEEGVDDLSELTGRDTYAYRVWRREGNGEGRDEVAPTTLRGQLATLRAFLRFCADIEAVPPDLFDRVPLPNLSSGQDVSDTTLEPDRAKAILEYLERYHYASRDHLTVLLGWQTGARIGGLRALDLRDLDLEAKHPRISGPAIHFVHRPDTDTPLKNKEKSTRWNRISEHVAQVIRDYRDGPRDRVRDEHGRRPLLTTPQGRPAASTIRATLYRVTRPCWRGAACPHDRDPETCEATIMQKASTCPSARSPHDLRSGRVTDHRRNDVPRVVVSEELDVSEDVLDKHYDRRTAREQAEQRAQYLTSF